MANNWIELNGKKEPQFDTKMIVLLGNGTKNWYEVFLKKIETTSTGREYVFTHAQDSEIEYTTATHYMIPEPPKNNQ